MKTLSEYINDFAYIDYSEIVKGTTYDNPLTIFMFGPLNEVLMTTYSIDKTIRYIKDYFDLSDNQIHKVKGAGDVERILVKIANRDNNLEVMKRAMSYCGYYLGAPKEDKIPKDRFVELQFEPLHQKNISDELRKEEKTLIHVTPKYNLKKIQSIGFSPRCKNELFDYPGRIYFIRGSMSNKIAKCVGEMLNRANMSLGNTGEYVAVTVDLEKIPESVKFFEDPNFIKGVFVNENLRPEIIEHIEEFKL